MKNLLYTAIFLIIGTQLWAQTGSDLDLANEYFAKRDFEKALVYYDRLDNNKNNWPIIYENYLQTLLKLKEYKDARKFVERVKKENQDNLTYDLDIGLIKIAAGDNRNGKEYLEDILDEIEKNPIKINKATSHLIKRNQTDWAEKFFLQSRKALKEEYHYARDLINLYEFTSAHKKLIDQTMIIARHGSGHLEYIENTLQNNLQEESDFDYLERQLYIQIQDYPTEIAYNQLLVWLYIQQKEFQKAFRQAKAVDKRLHQNGMGLFDLGEIAFENNRYEDAIDIFSHITKNYPKQGIYSRAKQQLIHAKENKIKNTYPVTDEAIRSLIRDYQHLNEETINSIQLAENNKSIAHLQAFYLGNIDTALTILSKIIETPRLPQKLIAESKLLLGDVYLLHEEPWESTLLYYQVEKDFKDQPLGHLAKLKNAKLSYYTGDFELAQSHLDVLKLATSRVIANDAMDLSLLIQDNSALDTSFAALQEFASIDLLIFRNEKEEAMDRLKAMNENYKDHALTDEIYMTLSELYIQNRQIDSAIVYLNKIASDYKEDIYIDDAYFLLGEVYEIYKNDVDAAMEFYKKLLISYPGSIFTAEARKRFRSLRGDKLN